MKRLLIFILLFGLIASSYAQSRLGVTTDASLVSQTDPLDPTIYPSSFDFQTNF